MLYYFIIMVILMGKHINQKIQKKHYIKVRKQFACHRVSRSRDSFSQLMRMRKVVDSPKLKSRNLLIMCVGP